MTLLNKVFGCFGNWPQTFYEIFFLQKSLPPRKTFKVILCNKYLYSELFWSALSRIRTEYGKTRRYGVSLNMQSKCGKMPTRITPNADTFHAVWSTNETNWQPTRIFSLERFKHIITTVRLFKTALFEKISEGCLLLFFSSCLGYILFWRNAWLFFSLKTSEESAINYI